MNPTAETERKSHALLADAAVWRVLSLLFQRPAGAWLQELRALARELADPEIATAVEAASEVGEGEYLAWLGPGGAIAPREPAYQPLQDPGRLLADLSGFYEAFAYRPRQEDPPDHIATELGFAGFLRLKAAYAWKAGRPRDAELTSRALHRFLVDHLAPFLVALRGQVASLGAPDHLRLAAEIAGKRVRLVTELVDIATG